MRFALAELGPQISVRKRSSGQPNPITTVSRHNNGFFFSGYVPDMTVEMRWRFPQGAPIFVGCDAEMIAGQACYRMPRAWRRECRLFVEQSDGVVSCHEKTAEMIGLKRRLRITGLNDATVRVYPENNDRPVTLVLNGTYPYYEGPFPVSELKSDRWGRYLEAKHLVGELVVTW